MLITFNNVSLQYLDKDVLNNVSFTINDTSKVGLIGTNGAGKTSILKLMVGEITPSSGVIYKKNGLKIGYLAQNVSFKKGETILNEAKRISENENEYELVSILNKLGLNNLDKIVDNLSGGEKKRLHLASVLSQKTDMLILDEPTNHLDIAMISWLEKFLIKYNKGLVLVTHDRYFLERITKEILEIENAKVYSYDANYTKFLTLKAERLESLKASERKLSQILKKEAKWMALNPQARTTKSKERIERFFEFEDTLKDIKTNLSSVNKEFELSTKQTRIGKKTIIIENLNLTINEKTILKDFNYIVNRYDRLGIVGNNGTGKTTLLNAIMGLIQPEYGKITIGETIKLGYFKQVDEILESSIKVIDYLKQFGEYVETEQGKISVSQLLENYFFTPDMQRLPINRLSGGEKRRLSLLKVLLQNPNVLLLDEPTNDFDIYTIEVLEDFLESFKGAIIVISHDRYFLDKICHHLMIYKGQKLNEYMFSITEYLQTHEFTLEQNKTPKIKEAKIEIPRFTSSQKKEYDHIEEKIASLEDALKLKNQEINESGSDYELLIRLSKEKEDIEKELEQSIQRWEFLENINEQIKKYKEGKYNGN